PELSHWRERSAYLKAAMEWTKERIFCKRHPETWFFSARAFSKKANAEEQGRTLSGLHAKFVMVAVDESGEVPPAVMKAGEQAFSSQSTVWGRAIQAGNPS